LINTGNLDKAIYVAILIQDTSKSGILYDSASKLHDICKLLIKSEDFDKAFNVSNMIADDSKSKEIISSYLCEKLLESDCFDFIQTIEEIPETSYNESIIFQDILEILMRVNYFNKTIDASQTILSIKRGHLKKIMDIVGSVPEVGEERVRLLTYISEILAQHNIEKAISVAKIIPEHEFHYFKVLSLRRICYTLVKNGNLNRAIEVALTTPQPFTTAVLSETYKFLIDSGKTDKAIEITKSINHEEIRQKAFHILTNVLIETENIGKSIDVAKLITAKSTHRTFAIQEICKKLVIRGNIDQAIEVCQIFPEEPVISGIRDYICKMLIEHDDIDKAIEVGQIFSNETGQGMFVQAYICKALIDRGFIDKAFGVAKTILAETDQGAELLVSVGMEFIERGNIDRAIELAKIIPENSPRKQALQDEIDRN